MAHGSLKRLLKPLLPGDRKDLKGYLEHRVFSRFLRHMEALDLEKLKVCCENCMYIIPGSYAYLIVLISRLI